MYASYWRCIAEGIFIVFSLGDPAKAGLRLAFFTAVRVIQLTRNKAL
jgi:hypothetical protein